MELTSGKVWEIYILLESFGQEKFGEWIDQAKNNDCEAHITACRIVLCTMLRLKILVCFRVLAI